MTKNEYLIMLAARLQKLTDDPRGIYPELRSLIEFYQEMIDDKIEDGMTEDEAVAAMESPEEIAERIINEFGEFAAEAEGGDVAKREAGRVIRREYSPEKVKLVKVNAPDHEVRIVTGPCVALNYQDDQNGRFEAGFENGVLELKYIYNKRSFMLFRMLMSWKRCGNEVIVELPKGWGGNAEIRTANAPITAEADVNELEIHTSNGPVILEDTSARRITGGTGNGPVKLEGVAFDEMELATSNGRITAKGISGGRARLTSSNAHVSVQDAAVGDMLLKSSNGSICAEGFTGDRFHAKTSNAAIKVERIAAGDIALVTSNGSVSGAVCGKMQDYSITSKTSNGGSNLPDGTEGAKKLEVRTSNGNISVGFEEKINAEV